MNIIVLLHVRMMLIHVVVYFLVHQIQHTDLNYFRKQD